MLWHTTGSFTTEFSLGSVPTTLRATVFGYKMEPDLI